jgi:hypothetical protein
MACAVGVIGVLASFGLFIYAWRWDFYIYFTNLSNYLCIGILFAELVQTIRKKEDSFVSVCPPLKFLGMVSIAVTFIVFNFVLAPYRAPELNFAANSVLLHIAVPILYIGDWILFYERKRVKWSYPLIAVSFPTLYVAFVYIHAAILNFDTSIADFNNTGAFIYPYFFLNPEIVTEAGVVVCIVALAAFFIGLGYIFFGIDKLSVRRKK